MYIAQARLAALFDAIKRFQAPGFIGHNSWAMRFRPKKLRMHFNNPRDLCSPLHEQRTMESVCARQNSDSWSVFRARRHPVRETKRRGDF